MFTTKNIEISYNVKWIISFKLENGSNILFIWFQFIQDIINQYLDLTFKFVNFITNNFAHIYEQPDSNKQ